MTTIAYKDGILAADTQLTLGTMRLSDCHKIQRLQNDIIVACAGGVDLERYFHKWLLGEKIPRAKIPTKKFEAIVIKDKNAYWYQDGLEDHLIPAGANYAIGSGWMICKTFMHSGLSAKEAVKATSELDIYTNKKVDTYDTKYQKITYGK
jgi:ATP-dependent protease HslVU (ClpYQ) peptidase subunit